MAAAYRAAKKLRATGKEDFYAFQSVLTSACTALMTLADISRHRVLTAPRLQRPTADTGARTI
jgi:hypothetical protein